mgnify:CR=1 FL=1
MSCQFLYSAYGMKIASDIPLFLPECTDICKEKHIVIAEGEVELSSDLPYHIGDIRYGYADLDVLHIHIPWVAAFRIVADSHIQYDPIIGVADDTIGMYLVNIVLLFIVRNTMLCMFHGSAVVHTATEQSLVLIGQKGAGKSTTATALTRQDFALLADDIVPITGTPEVPLVCPGIPVSRLMADALTMLIPEPTYPLCVHDGLEKYYVPAVCSKQQTPAELGIMCVLSVVPALTKYEVHEICGVEKLRVVLPHLLHIPGLDTPNELFRSVSSILNKIRVVTIRRPCTPIDRSSLSELEEILLQYLADDRGVNA